MVSRVHQRRLNDYKGKKLSSMLSPAPTDAKDFNGNPSGMAKRNTISAFCQLVSCVWAALQARKGCCARKTVYVYRLGAIKDKNVLLASCYVSAQELDVRPNGGLMAKNESSAAAGWAYQGLKLAINVYK